MLDSPMPANTGSKISAPSPSQCYLIFSRKKKNAAVFRGYESKKPIPTPKGSGSGKKVRLCTTNFGEVGLFYPNATAICRLSSNHPHLSARPPDWGPVGGIDINNPIKSINNNNHDEASTGWASPRIQNGRGRP